ncbi:MAG TPA: FecR family protein [Gallionella sp.]
MKTTSNIPVFLAVLLTACLTFFGSTAYAGIAGHAQFVNGSVQITNAAGQTRALQKGDVVHESDTVTTAKGASAQIRMRDDGMIAIRPDSRLKFDSFVFTGKIDGNEKSFFTLLRGGFRAITGLIGKKNKENYRISTTAATIGIRGTDHETFVVLPGSELATTVPAGTYNKVNSGETVMTTGKGSINILPNQMGYAAASDQMPQLQPVNLDLFTAVPSPMQGSKTEAPAREGTVVDGAIQEQNMGPDNAVVPANPTLRPIVEDRGPIAPPRVF